MAEPPLILLGRPRSFGRMPITCFLPRTDQGTGRDRCMRCESEASLRSQSYPPWDPRLPAAGDSHPRLLRNFAGWILLTFLCSLLTAAGSVRLRGPIHQAGAPTIRMRLLGNFFCFLMDVEGLSSQRPRNTGASAPAHPVYAKHSAR